MLVHAPRKVASHMDYMPLRAPRKDAVEYDHNTIDELGYPGVAIFMKCGGALEFKDIRRRDSTRKPAATVPIDVFIR